MNKVICGFLIAIFISVPAVSAPAEEEAANPVPGLSKTQVLAIIDGVSGLRALEHIYHISLHHRWFVSDGYGKAAAYVKEKAEEYGLKDVAIHNFPSDGSRWYSAMQSLPRWTVRSARLSLVSPVERHLVSWEESPIVLASNSRSADITAELVDVGEGTNPSDYEGKDVAGKLVLASSPQNGGRIDLVHRLAVFERGAAGVIAYRSYYLDDFPDLITWDHINTLEYEGHPSTFGFCLSKRMGWALKRLLDKGEQVKLHAVVDASLSPGDFQVVEGRIGGSGQGEIWFVAHLDHCKPSANDNASGSAAILEAARSLNDLISSGILPKPRMGFRFLWVPEIWGTTAYLTENMDALKRVKAVINMDMVGEDQVACGSTFEVTKTPASMPSFFNDLLEINLDFLLSHADDPNGDLDDPFSLLSPGGRREPWKAHVVPYSGGSDHYVFMGGGGAHVPATMFGSWPDYFYHSSGDTPDKSDPTQLKRAVVLGVLTAASLSEMDPASAVDLMDIVAARGRARLEQAVAASPLERGDILNVIDWTARREDLVLKSLAGLFDGDPEVSEAAGVQARFLRARADELASWLSPSTDESAAVRGLSPEERAASDIVPYRLPGCTGPITQEYLIMKTSESDLKPFLRLGGPVLYEIGAFMDGKLSALDIRNAVSAEFQPVEVNLVIGYIRLLKRAGLVSFSE